MNDDSQTLDDNQVPPQEPTLGGGGAGVPEDPASTEPTDLVDDARGDQIDEGTDQEDTDKLSDGQAPEETDGNE